MITETKKLLKDEVRGARQISNFIWIGILAIGGFGFALASLECYFKVNLLPLADTLNLEFIPQGITMLFYGTVALGLMTYIFLLTYWDIGSGINEFDSENEVVRIIRKGFPGQNREILITYTFDKIRSVEIVVEDGLNPRRTLFLCTKDQRKIPLYPSSQLFTLENLESRASEIANILGVNLEGNLS